MFIKQIKERSGWGKWSKVNVYRCAGCGAEYRLRVSWQGSTPPGGIRCPHCDHINNL